MALILKLRSGDVEACPELQFDAPRIVVGRAPGCELQLPDPSVSGRQASFRQRGSNYVVVDEGSDNGTFSGLARLPRQAPHTLSDGELLRLGRVWVEVRIRPGGAPSEPGSSRELARTLVQHALERDGKPSGMQVRLEAPNEAGATLVLDQPRTAYWVGQQKSSDLRIEDPAVPKKALELKRQGDQLWVTLATNASAALDGRELAPGERTLWARGNVLTLYGRQLTLSDPIFEMLERLERGPTERLDPDAPIDPPDGHDTAENAENSSLDAAGDSTRAEDDAEDDERASEPPWSRASRPELPRNTAQLLRQRRAPHPGLGGTWTRADAIVLLLALSVLGLSLWAIKWIAALGPA